MKRKILFCAFLIAITISFSACSYVEFENGIKEKMNHDDEMQSNLVEDDDIKSNIEDENNQINSEERSQESEGSVELKEIGDCITIEDSLSKMIYTINNVTIYNNLSEAGIDLSEIGYYQDDSLNNPFVLIDLTVENNQVKQSVESYNIGVFHLLNYEILSDPWFQDLPEIAYFSEHKENIDSEYFHYELSEGEKMECKIGWILGGAVPTDQDLILHVGASTKSMEFVKLN